MEGRLNDDVEARCLNATVFRPIDLFVLRPSVDLGKIAADQLRNHLP